MKDPRNDIRTTLLLLIGDILVINSGILFSYWLRFNSGLFPIIKGIPHVSNYYGVLPILTIIILSLMRGNKLYSLRSRLSVLDEFFVINKVISIAVLFFMAGTFMYREYSFSRGMLIALWGILIVFVGGWRFLAGRIRMYARSRSPDKRELLLIGDSEMVPRLITHISGDPHWDYGIKGVVRIGPTNEKEVNGVPVLGDLSSLGAFISSHEIQEVILADAELPRRKVLDIILECEKSMVEFRVIADLLGMVTSQVDMRTIDGIPFLGIKESPLSEAHNRLIKRSMDFALSLAGLLVLSPLLLLIALVVKLSSPGPVFYFQKRIGEDGRRFSMFKFRTMVDKAEKGTGQRWTVKDDPRRTGPGIFLRRTNLDELPQLINVLKGEMSLVGPRPERPHFVGKFKEDIPRYMARHRIKSGVTGWAQVNGLRGNTSISERTKYDLYYMENWSLAFDLKILFMSIFAFKNAY